MISPDEVLMRRTFALAKQGLGYTRTNPLVGAVIVDQAGMIIAEGYHHKFGEAHAEVDAIRRVEDKTKLVNATLYVNLEPCDHHGKQPPCTNAIIEAEIGTVVISNVDPHDKVNGSGIQRLKKTGVAVRTGVCEKEGLELNKRFFTNIKNKRPYIILKWAQCQNGYIGGLSSNGTPTKQTISGEGTKGITHHLRHSEDAILIGRQTLLTDNPLLDIRHYGSRNHPIRIVLGSICPNDYDTKLHLWTDHKSSTWVLNTNLSSGKSLKSSLIKEVIIEKDNWQEALWNISSKENVGSILVEGGCKTLMSFIDSNTWDEAHVFVSKSKMLSTGVSAPIVAASPVSIKELPNDYIHNYINENI